MGYAMRLEFCIVAEQLKLLGFFVSKPEVS